VSDRPNILILMTDEQNVHMSSVYGHPFVKTPNMQRLADRGVVMDAAYCNSPTCVASRASLMTSRYPSQIGVYDLSSMLSSEQPTWAHIFNAAGYETVLCGKMHFVGPDQRHGFTKRLVEDCHGDGMHHGVPNWDAIPRRGKTNITRIEQAGRAGRNSRHDYDCTVRDEAVRYLEEYAKGGSDKPFVLCASFIAPHFPLVVPEKYFNMYYPDHADLPMHPEPIDHPMYHRLRYVFGLDQHIDPDAVRRCRAAYYGLITFVDELIGDVLDALERTRLAENTFIIFTSDHGEMLGERGLWWKSALLDHSARVPMIFSFPGRLPENERRSGVISNIDLAPTMCEIAGIPVPDFFEGQSAVALLEGETGGWKDEALVEYLAHGAIHPQAALRKGRYKLIYSMHERSQLYDLEADPYELRDLAHEARYAPVARAMERELLGRWPAERIDREVRESQRMRRILHAGLQKPDNDEPQN